MKISRAPPVPNVPLATWSAEQQTERCFSDVVLLCEALGACERKPRPSGPLGSPGSRAARQRRAPPRGGGGRGRWRFLPQGLAAETPGPHRRCCRRRCRWPRPARYCHPAAAAAVVAAADAVAAAPRQLATAATNTPSFSATCGQRGPPWVLLGGWGSGHAPLLALQRGIGRAEADSHAAVAPQRRLPIMSWWGGGRRRRGLRDGEWETGGREQGGRTGKTRRGAPLNAPAPLRRLPPPPPVGHSPESKRAPRLS